MKVKDIMHKSIVAANSNSSIHDISKMMKDFDIGFMPIMENDNFIGVITDRDIALNLDNDDITDIMSNPIITISEDANLIDALKTMATYKIKRLMVEDDGKVNGVISISDIIINIDDNIIKYIREIYSDNIELTNEIDIPTVEVDSFEL